MQPEPESESIRRAMDEAWRDHRHTRDQTWKALQIEFGLAIAVVGAAWQTQSKVVVASAALFVFIVAFCGIQITLRHRNSVELTKFRHILNCEEALGLHREDLIGGVNIPAPVTFLDVFRWGKANTPIFILRMHIAILLFALFILIWRLVP